MNKVKGKTKKELAQEYEYSRKTIAQMCKEAGIFTRKRLTAKEVKLFYETFGLPLLDIK